MSPRTVIVTGAGRGIGAATARLLATADVNLALADIDRAALDEVAVECSEAGATVLAEEFDQEQPESIERLFACVDSKFGSPDALANIVGLYPNEPIATMSNDFWDHVLATNLTGLFQCCRAGMKRMLARGSGCIINISSPKVYIPGHGFSAYAASKGGVEAFSRVLALESAPQVRVNVVCPGGPVVNESDDRNLKDSGLTHPPLARWCRPEDVAEAIVFLMSDQSSFITGQVIRVDGGRNMA